jgi:hypothetical protein
MTDLNFQTLPSAIALRRHVASLSWGAAARAARAAVVIAVLLAVASVPMLLRLWLFYPALHN